MIVFFCSCPLVFGLCVPPFLCLKALAVLLARHIAVCGWRLGCPSLVFFSSVPASNDRAGAPLLFKIIAHMFIPTLGVSNPALLGTGGTVTIAQILIIVRSGPPGCVCMSCRAWPRETPCAHTSPGTFHEDAV